MCVCACMHVCVCVCVCVCVYMQNVCVCVCAYIIYHYTLAIIKCPLVYYFSYWHTELPTVTIEPNSITVNETDSAVFECRGRGKPRPALSWTRENSNKKLIIADGYLTKTMGMYVMHACYKVSIRTCIRICVSVCVHACVHACT